MPPRRQPCLLAHPAVSSTANVEVLRHVDVLCPPPPPLALGCSQQYYGYQTCAMPCEDSAWDIPTMCGRSLQASSGTGYDVPQASAPCSGTACCQGVQAGAGSMSEVRHADAQACCPTSKAGDRPCSAAMLPSHTQHALGRCPARLAKYHTI